MIQRIMARAKAASVEGLIGSHLQALAALLLKRGSTTAILKFRCTSDFVTSSAIGVMPKLASAKPVPQKMTNSLLRKSALKWFLLFPVARSRVISEVLTKMLSSQIDVCGKRFAEPK